MGDKVVLTVALAGALTQKGEGKGMTPYLPITPDEMAEEAKRCHDAGASVVHIHARDSKTGQAVPDLDIYREIVEKTRAKCPILINITTGGGVDQTLDERLAPIPALQPDMASYTSGSLSYGMYSKSQKSFIYDVALGLPYSELLRFAQTMLDNGTRPE